MSADAPPFPSSASAVPAEAANVVYAIAAPANPVPANAEPANAAPANPVPANAEPANAEPANAEPANAEPANAEPANAVCAEASSAPPALRPVGAFRLLSAFTREQADPDGFYTLLARDSVALIERHTPLDGRRVADVGGGAGYFTAAFRARGAQCLLVEPDPGELYRRGAPGRASVIGDGYWLPLAEASVDVCFSSNVLEHVRDPSGFIDEMIRVTRPGGLVYLSYTVWLSPWGGHESSPFHYLGGHYAARRYARRHGQEPKNLFGQTMFPLGVGRVLALVRRRPDVSVVEARPRYYPRWCRFIIFLPGLRELLTWNLLVIVRRLA